jgi:hypothetical protein
VVKEEEEVVEEEVTDVPHGVAPDVACSMHYTAVLC